ncbi:MAG: methionine--tRNA ligase, partial [Candidatus Vogelbacteria bacterium]|nr:methionine--tRNA ligase [Candidatus Vogelbacteria bacterium]
MEIVQADILARYYRSIGDKVFFNTGTDEHGQKIYEAAEKAGQNVKDYVDHYANEFKKLKNLLNLSNDTFVRTTDPKHEEATKAIWQKCKDSGDIEKREYSGLYCVGCELYKSKRDLDENGRCSLHPNQELVTLKESNYFFKFSKYQDQLLDYLAKPDSIIPEWKRQEAINFVKEGLEDFSISRQRGQLEWGIPVPGDDEQVMYVWFDALTNYISTLGWPNEEGDFKTFWQDGHVLQCAGKDQVRFQSLMWQAMLM